MVRVIEDKIIWKWSEGKQKLLRVSGSFELSRVRVSEGKITVNVWRKSRRNRFWFELARGSSQRGFELSRVNCTHPPSVLHLFSPARGQCSRWKEALSCVKRFSNQANLPDLVYVNSLKGISAETRLNGPYFASLREWIHGKCVGNTFCLIDPSWQFALAGCLWVGEWN